MLKGNNLPADSQKVAVIFADYKQITTPDTGATEEEPQRLLGEYQMNVRHLTKSGCIPVVVMCNEFQQQKTLFDKIIYLRGRLQQPSSANVEPPRWQ